MRNIAKKIVIVGMVGMMQLGLGASIMEASPLYNELAAIQQYDDQDQNRKEAERIENERHERAMERRPNESEPDWDERQNRENQRHEKNLLRIARAVFFSF
jgi:membrane protein involved in colicin uptake